MKERSFIEKHLRFKIHINEREKFHGKIFKF